MAKFRKTAGLLCVLIFSILFSMNAQAETADEYLNSLNAGVTNVIDPTVYSTDQFKEAVEELNSIVAQNQDAEQDEDDSTLFMANVENSVNVREEADENSTRVGLLYKDCGGRILEKGDGWTRIQSGDLVGWVSNDYLLFGDEAENLAEDVGFKILTVNADALRVRKEPSQDSEILTLVANGDELDVVDDSDTEWVEIEYEGEDGYVLAEYGDITFRIDCGETMEAIEKREAEEAEAARQAKLHEQQAKVQADNNDVRLLAALIQCEAGIYNADAQLAVGAVVMNRVRSGAYPNTVYGVIYASGQFTPALNGKVAATYNGKVYDSCLTAAQNAINGQTNVGTATHFRRSGGDHEGVYIGGQVFW